MFFILSKILAILLKPLTLVLFLGGYAFLGKNARRRYKSGLAALVILFICTNPWLITVISHYWETPRENLSTIQQPYDIGVLLGGYTDFNVANSTGTAHFNRSANRMVTTLTLYKTGKIKHILLTGGDGRILGRSINEALVARWYLQQNGVPDSAILVETRSRNTRENALFSKMMVDSLMPGARCLIITSAWHIRRSEGCFQKVGLPCDFFGTDFFEEQGSGNPFEWIEPDWKALMKWESLIKEWIGYVVYKMKGWC